MGRYKCILLFTTFSIPRHQGQKNDSFLRVYIVLINSKILNFICLDALTIKIIY